MRTKKLVSFAVLSMLTILITGIFFAQSAAAASLVQVKGPSVNEAYIGSSVSPFENLEVTSHRFVRVDTGIQVYRNNEWTGYSESTFQAGTYRLNLNIYAISGEDELTSFTVPADASYNGAACETYNCMRYALRAYTQPFTVSEIKTYDITVAGTQVTSRNAADVLGDGVFSYDPVENVLYVNGDCACRDSVIKSSVDDLTINVQSNSNLTSFDSSAIFFAGHSGKITGSGVLFALSDAYSGIFIRGSGATLTIEDAYVIANGRTIGLSGNSDEQLVINNSVVTGIGTEQGAQGAIGSFGSITLKDCYLLYPYYAVNKNGNIYESDGSTLAGIAKIGFEEYGLAVAGTEVNNSNASDVLGNGVFSYDPDTKTLYVKGSYTDTANKARLISNTGVDGLTVNIAANKTLTANYSVIYCEKNTKITGGKNVTLTSSSSNPAVYAKGDGVTLTVEDADLTVSGSIGVKGYGYENLLIKNSEIKADGLSFAIGDFNSIELDGCKVSSPGDAVIQNGFIYESDGTTPAKTVIVSVAAAEEYPLYVAETTVTTENAGDILGDGVFSYDAETKTLTVNGDCTAAGSVIYNNGINGLTINIEGDSTLASDMFSCISCAMADTKITGSGKLTLSSAQSSSIYIYGGVLTIENADITASGSWGIAGVPSNESLVIINSNITAGGTLFAIGDFPNGITIKDCEIVSPKDAVNQNGNIYESDGMSNAAEVTIATKKEDTEIYVYGDADANGSITASDATFVLQKALVSTFRMPIEDKTDNWLKYMDVDCDGKITAGDSTFILQKALVSTFTFPAETNIK